MFADYWNFWPCAYNVLQSLEANFYSLDNHENITENARKWLKKGLEKFPFEFASTKPIVFGSLFTQHWEGFFGWRLIATHGEKKMKCTINLVLKDQFQEYFDQDLNRFAFRGNFKTKLIYKQNILSLILRLLYFTGSNGRLELSIGEIVMASSTTKDDLEEYSYELKSGMQYGYGLKPEQLITVTALIRGTSETKKWILSVGDFLPFVSAPDFRS